MASPTATPSPSPSSPRWHCYHWCTGTAFNFNDYFGIGDLPTSDPLSSDSSSIYSFIGSDVFVVLCGVIAALLIVLCYCACCRGARRGVVESTECAVCLDEFTEEENLRWMPNCQHAFHPPCIDAWLRSHSDCPICRAPITGPPLPSAPPLVVSPVIFQGAGDVVVVVDAGRSS